MAEKTPEEVKQLASDYNQYVDKLSELQRATIKLASCQADFDKASTEFEALKAKLKAEGKL